MPLQLAAVAALIALIFGLPRLRGQPTPIPDPTPRPLIEVAAPLPEATAVDRPAHEQASARARPKRKPKTRRRHSAERQLPAAQRELAIPTSDEAQSAPSEAATPAREFGWP